MTDPVKSTKTAILLTATVPIGTPDEPGVYDSRHDKNINLGGKYSSIMIESITGADNIDLELWAGNNIHSNLKKIKSLITYGVTNNKDERTSFNRVIFKNYTGTVITVEIRLNNYGIMYYSNPGGGGSRIAKHVTIDGTPTFKVVGAMESDVNVKTMPKMDVKDGALIGLAEGTTIEVSKIPPFTSDPLHPIAVDVGGVVNMRLAEDPTIHALPPMAIKAGEKVGIDGPVKIDDSTPVSMALEDGTRVGITGPVDVIFDTTDIKVVVAPPPAGCQGSEVAVGKTSVELAKAMPARHTIMIQSNSMNTSNIWVQDYNPGAPRSFVEIVPGGSFDMSYTGALYAVAQADNQKVLVMETFNT